MGGLQAELFGGEVSHDFFAASTDSLYTYFSVESLHGCSTQVASTAEDLYGFSGAVFKRRGGLNLALCDISSGFFASVQPVREQFHPRLACVHFAAHVDDLVPDNLVGNQWLSKRHTVFRIRNGLIDAQLTERERLGD
jgi:hypothetical protein